MSQSTFFRDNITKRFWDINKVSNITTTLQFHENWMLSMLIEVRTGLKMLEILFPSLYLQIFDA